MNNDKILLMTSAKKFKEEKDIENDYLQNYFASFFIVATIFGFVIFSIVFVLEISINPAVLVFIYMAIVSIVAGKMSFGKLKEKLVITKKKESIWKKSLLERSSGFPSLLKYIEYFESLVDEALAGYLRYKKHPARKSAEIVQEQSRKRREAEKKLRQTQALIEYYENIAPFLVDYKGDIISEEEEIVFGEYSDKEKQDPASYYLTKEEYRKLSNREKNQMALDRFWKRNKSKWLIGRLYERYVGYLYEEKGYDVEYVGIFKGKEDLGRDLICKKNNEIVIVQCKRWSKFKRIYEKHIFQFFGTVFKYTDENKGKNVHAVFYCTTKLSDLARRFANELDIELVENHKFDQQYPCIKCNISRVDGQKIYHLPFDQQYDNTKIEIDREESYASTVKEAEEKGFRRAWRWKGTEKD